MWTDASKGITVNISYNLLNLPATVTANGKTAIFTYDASGRKLRKVSAISGVSTDYIDGIQYEAGAISFIQTEEGRALNSSGNYHYEYSLTDHLGNSRLTFDTYSGAASTVQQDDYLPFGYEISRGTITSPKNEYLYNKKELQEDLVLEDYGARFYDPLLARWTTVDPLAEEDRAKTPYSYTFDDPIRHTDPDGMFGEDANDGPGDLIQPTSEHFRHEHPILAAIHDVAYAITDFTGLKDLENSVGHVGDKGVSAKDKAGHVFQAAANVFMLGEDGESEGIHKNSNDYVGHQGVYEIKVDGEVHKYGKADMSNTSKTTGEPKRLQTQLNKLQKENPAADVKGKVIYEHKNISTKEIKAIETINIKEFTNKKGKTPPGNNNHPGT